MSLFLGSFPLVSTTGTIYDSLKVPLLEGFYFEFYHTIGGFLLIYVLLSSNLLQELFSGKIMVFLGNISFSLYVFHLLFICSVSTSIFSFLLNYLSYRISFLVTFALSIAILFPFSYLCYKYLDKKGIVFGNKVYQFLNFSRIKNNQSIPDKKIS